MDATPIERVASPAEFAQLPASSRSIDRLHERINAEPKTRGWRLRDRIGDRERWYEEPEEVT